MNLRRILRSVFPAPRKPVTARALSPLIVFLVLFGVLCVVLDRLDVVLFTHLWPFFYLLLAPWLWWMWLGGYSGLPSGRALAALISRLALLGLLIVVLAEPRAVRTDETLSVVYVVDASSSITQGAMDSAMGYVVDSVSTKPAEDRAGLVFFGRDAAVELPPAASFPYETMNVQVDRDGTSLAEALSLSAAMLPDEHQGRIVLVTDGIATEGELARVLDDLKGRDVAVDVLPIQYSYQHEVWLERLELPRAVKTGETYEAAVILSSLTDGSGRLVLRENGEVIFDQEVEYHAGKNRVSVPVYLREAGYYEYTAAIEPAADQDTWLQNNHAISYLYLRGKGKVLLVTDPTGDERDWRELADTIVASRRDVEVVSAFMTPRDPLALQPYDAIVMVNVPAETLDQVQQQAIHDAVYNQGSGLLMVGGANSFGPGGYQRTPIEAALPVSMDVSQKKVLPKGALAIILHTCEFPQGNTWGKRITKQAMRVLNERDEVGVLVFDWQGGASWLFPLTPAGQYEQLITKVNNAQIGDMPDFGTTMALGLKGLQASDASARHMIIISDGDPQPPTPQLVNQFIASGVSVSMVAVFPHGGQDQSKMRAIAASTGGRYYFPQDPNTLPSIFIKEAKTIRRSAIQNKTFVPDVTFSSPILKGITSMPPLHGYVTVTAKPRSTVILQAPEEEDVDPILATWRYGLGATAAFTSDLSPNWAKDWLAWDSYEPFVKQMLLDISRPEEESQLRVRTYPTGGQGTILVEDYSPQAAFLEVRARVEGPRGDSKEIELKQTGPGRYEAQFPLTGQGRYQVMAVGAGDGREERTHGGFVVPYSQEFLRFRSNPIVLEEIAGRTGGRLLAGQSPDEPGSVYQVDRSARQSSRPIVDWLLVLLACLIPLDVGLRRVQIDWGVVKAWFTPARKATQSEETFGALLTRKKDVATQLEYAPQTSRGGRVDPAVGMRRRAAATSETTPGGETSSAKRMPSEAEQESDESVSTTARLLAAKRRARGGDGDDSEGA